MAFEFDNVQRWSRLYPHRKHSVKHYRLVWINSIPVIQKWHPLPCLQIGYSSWYYNNAMTFEYQQGYNTDIRMWRQRLTMTIAKINGIQSMPDTVLYLPCLYTRECSWHTNVIDGSCIHNVHDIRPPCDSVYRAVMPSVPLPMTPHCKELGWAMLVYQSLKSRNSGILAI